jgi:MinD-like ATPase involved in chromosome partitioning or flagellar assembly
MPAIRIVTCAGGAPWEAPIVRGLQRRELGVELARRCVDHGELLGVALRDRPRAAVVAADLPWLDRELVGTLQDSGVVVISIGASSGTRSLEGIGVAHRLPDAATADDLAALLYRIGANQSLAVSSPTPPPMSESTATAPDDAGRRMVAVWGAAGAPGRTTVAIHLAVEAARRGQSVLLVDGDAWSASIAQVLNLDEAPSVTQAARLAGEGWLRPLETCLQPGPSGGAVLAGLARAELWPEVRERAWISVLDAARETRPLVVVDLAAPIEEDEELAFDRVPYRRNLMTLATLAAADEVLLVAGGDPVGIRRGIVAHRTLADARPDVAQKVRVVVNRAPRSARRVQECSSQLSEWTGLPPLAFLPFEPQFERSVWEGSPLHVVAPRSSWLRELRELLTAVAPVTAVTA